MPAALYEPLVARLYAAPAALPVAAAAAAAGQAVDRSLLADTMAMPSEDLDSSLRTLVDAEILEPIGSRYRFRHELLREVAYELQPPSWRRKVHDRLCDLLVRDEPSDWHVLATHFERADRLSEAATAYQHTAEEARRRGALDEALGHLTHAIDLVAGLDEDAARDHREVRVRLLRGFLAMSEGGAGDPTAAEDFERCRELAAADPSGDDMFSTLIVAVGVLPVARRARSRPRRLGHPARGARGRARALPAPEPGRLRHARLVRRPLRQRGRHARRRDPAARRGRP